MNTTNESETERNINQDQASNTSALALMRTNQEASDEKHSEKLIVNRITHILGYLGLSEVTKTTQLRLQHLLVEGSENIPELISFDEIKRAYYEERLEAMKNHHKLFNVTKSETVLRSILRKITRMKIDKALLFGGSSIDLYLHPVAVALEVDGDYHNHEGKMIRDHYKIRICSLLGIKVMSIANEDIGSLTVKSFIEQVKSLPVLNSTKRREVFLTLMIYTLLVRNPKFLESYLGISMNRLNQLSLNGMEKMLVRYPLSKEQMKKMKRIMIRY